MRSPGTDEVPVPSLSGPLSVNARFLWRSEGTWTRSPTYCVAALCVLRPDGGDRGWRAFGNQVGMHWPPVGPGLGGAAVSDAESLPPGARIPVGVLTRSSLLTKCMRPGTGKRC